MDRDRDRPLVAIRDHLARGSPGFATLFAGRVVSRTESPDGQPLLGAEVPEYGDPTVRELFEHPYRILYRVDGADIQIIGVIHSSRRLPRTPPG